MELRERGSKVELTCQRVEVELWAWRPEAEPGYLQTMVELKTGRLEVLKLHLAQSMEEELNRISRATTEELDGLLGGGQKGRLQGPLAMKET